MTRIGSEGSLPLQDSYNPQFMQPLAPHRARQGPEEGPN